MEKNIIIANKNPKNKKTTDCVIRALTKALNKGIEEIITDLTAVYLKKGYFITDKKCVNHYLTKECNYTTMKQVKKENGKKYIANEFCEYLNKLKITEDVLASVGTGHITVFTNTGTKNNPNYKVYDSWDCTGKCVGTWWKK